jgi:16S rRNA G966 N2-methylase RsmD
MLRRYLRDETGDLVYLDPPFNSNQSYNVLFAEKDGIWAAARNPVAILQIYDLCYRPVYIAVENDVEFLYHMLW